MPIIRFNHIGIRARRNHMGHISNISGVMEIFVFGKGEISQKYQNFSTKFKISYGGDAMGRASLAICMRDQKYQERFVKCLINHYKQWYEIHAFTEMEEIDPTKQHTYNVVIQEEPSDEKLSFFVGETKQKVLVDKYQEVYKIMEEIESYISTELGQSKVTSTEKKAVEKIGVFSLDNPVAQLPYAAMLANVYGEKQKVLFVNLLPHCKMTDQVEESLGLEDLMATVETGNHSRGRILGGIGHKQRWDYIYPVKNSETLSECGRNIYEEIIDLLVKEQGYEVIIINFGSVFSGMHELMYSCEKFYLLEKAEDWMSWREQGFFEEMERREKIDFFNRIFRIKIPTFSCSDGDWESLAEKWEWGQLGDKARKGAWTER